MSARSIVIDTLETIKALEPALADVQISAAARDIGELDRPYLIVRTGEYAPTPQAPMRNITWSGTVTLVSPHRDQIKAEDQLEALLEVLGPHLLNYQMLWSSAPLTNYDEQHIALDINVTSIFQKE